MRPWVGRYVERMNNARKIVAELLEDPGAGTKIMETGDLKGDMTGGEGRPIRLSGPGRPPMSGRPGGAPNPIRDQFMMHLAQALGPDSVGIAELLISGKPMEAGHLQHLLDEFERMEPTPLQHAAVAALQKKLGAGSEA